MSEAGEDPGTFTYVRKWLCNKKAFEVSIAVCTTCKQIIEPVRRKRDLRRGIGEDMYVHVHPLAFVTLRNGNRREAIVDEELAEIADKIKNSWKFYADIYEVKRIILNWLMR
jgi:isopentenyl diphosphate isomerase/L-lactate dehydrogenase-like FMN-dependent dehydrogenase